MTKTLHSLPSTIESDTQADGAFLHLCLLCGFGGELIRSESFDLTPELQSQLEREFFDGPIPPSLLADSDWRFHIETLPGWEIFRFNDHVMQIIAGVEGVHTPAPFDISEHLLFLDSRADLNRLDEWPGLRKLFISHLVSNLSFLTQVPQLETLIFENISWVDDFSPFNQLTQLKEIGLGNGGYHDHAAGQTVLKKIREQAPHLPEFELSLWKDDVFPR
jgi:hypothetical protein